VQFSVATLADFLFRDSVSLFLSLVARRDDAPMGLTLISRRGWTSRVAAMGVHADAQGQGIGGWLLEQAIDAARARGDRAMQLEVFEQNTRAVRLYEKYSFRVLRRLLGFAGSTLSGEAAPLEMTDVAEVARLVAAWGSPDLPWQCGGETISKHGPPSVAYRMGESGAVISAPTADRIVIRALAVPPEQQRQGAATRLVSALIAAHPGKQWLVPQICPEEYAPIFTRNGFTREPLNQFQMMLTL
jgi:ribosomal protein S18 acetylase RimI-like enzyme